MSRVLSTDLRSVNPSFNPFIASDWLVSRHCPLSPAERSILRTILAHADWTTGEGAFPSLKTIAAEAGCSRATVCRALNHFDELAELDYPVKLIRERRYFNGQFTSNLYSIATNDNSQVRPPSLTVRQQELTPLNSNPDPDVLAPSLEKPEPHVSEAPREAAGEASQVSHSTPAIRTQIPKSNQAQRMRELIAERQRMIADGRLRLPTKCSSPAKTLTRADVDFDAKPTVSRAPMDRAVLIRQRAISEDELDWIAKALAATGGVAA